MLTSMHEQVVMGNHPGRRLGALYVSYELVPYLLRQGRDRQLTFEGMPEDAKLVSVGAEDGYPNTLVLIFESDSFPLREPATSVTRLKVDVTAEDLRRTRDHAARFQRILDGTADCPRCGAVGEEPCLDAAGLPMTDRHHVPQEARKGWPFEEAGIIMAEQRRRAGFPVPANKIDEVRASALARGADPELVKTLYGDPEAKEPQGVILVAKVQCLHFDDVGKQCRQPATMYVCGEPRIYPDMVIHGAPRCYCADHAPHGACPIADHSPGFKTMPDEIAALFRKETGGPACDCGAASTGSTHAEYCSTRKGK